MKTIESRIAPNPKEAQIWIDLNEDPHGLIKKYWNGNTWVTKDDNQNNNTVKLTADIEMLKAYVSELIEENTQLKTNINWLQQQYSDLYDLTASVSKLIARVNKLEQFIVTE